MYTLALALDLGNLLLAIIDRPGAANTINTILKTAEQHFVELREYDLAAEARRIPTQPPS
jgi:hypothetical protein